MSWKKRYSFRLTDKDEKVGHFINNLPFKSESEAIRQMLIYAYQHMTAEYKGQQQLNQIQDDIKQIKHSQERLYETIQNDRTPPEQTINQQIEDGRQRDKQTTDTVNAMLNSFGVEFD